VGHPVTVQVITLADPSRGLSSQIWPRPGIAFQGLNVAATTRPVSEQRQGGFGADDTTSQLDDAAVTLSLAFYANTRALLDELGQYCHPAARPVLTVTDTEWAQPRHLVLRFDSGNAPIELGKPTWREGSYAWRAPAGIWQGPVQSLTIAPILTAISTGLTWGVTGATWTTAGAVWPATTTPPASQALSAGNCAVPWTGTIYGPCTGPALYNDTTGQVLGFTTGLSLDLGEFITIDSTGIVQYGGSADPASSALGVVDYLADGFAWWQIQPGVNVIRYLPASADGASTAALSWSPGWIPT